MTKRIIMAALFFLCVMYAGKLVNDTLQVTVSNQVAVDQVESLDSPAVMVRSLPKMHLIVSILTILIAFAGSYYIFPHKQIKEKIIPPKNEG